MAPLFYTDSLADIRDILVFGEDMTNEDEEKQAMAELERLKQERREMRRKQREERKRKKEELDKDIAEGKKMMQKELEKMEKEEKQKELEKAEEKQEKIEEKTEKGGTKVWARNWRHDHFILEVVCEVHFMQQIQLAKQQPLTVLVAKNDAHQMVYCLYWVE